MKMASTQIDLFDDEPGYRQTPRPAPRKRRSDTVPPSNDDDDLARRLEETGRFRVLRRLVPRPIIPREQSKFPNLALLVDTETTGLLHTRDEIIEVSAVAFTYDDEGAVGDVVGIYSGLRQPSDPIPAEITRLTGITDEMVAKVDADLKALSAKP